LQVHFVVNLPLCLAAAIVLCVLGCSCSRGGDEPGDSNSPAGQQEGEKLQGGFSYTSTEGGRVVYEVDGEKATGLAGEVVRIEKPHLIWHLDDNVIDIRARKGRFNKSTEQISFSADVRVEAESGSMKCNQLDWDASSRKMTASGDVSGEFTLK